MIRAETPHGRRQTFDTLADYERSWMWENSRLRYALMGGSPVCFICGLEEIDLHHRTYANCGKELPDELVALCEDHHRMVERLVRGRWSSRWDAHKLLERRLALREGHELKRLPPLASLQIEGPT